MCIRDSFLLGQKLRSLQPPFAPSRTFPLERQHTVKIWVILLYPRVTQIQTQTDVILQMRVTPLVKSIVMHASLNVRSFVDYQAVFVNSHLRLYGVPLLFAAVMRLAFLLVFGSWALLFRCIQESLEAWKHRFNLVKRLQPLNFLLLFFWQRQNLAYQRFYLSDVFEYVALVEINNVP